MTNTLCSNAQFPIASNSSFVYKSPEGFEGALSTKSFVLSVTYSFSKSTVSLNEFFSLVSIYTGTPSAN